MSEPGSGVLHWLEQLNALDEHERVEAKRGSEIGRAVMQTVCAFANEPGLQGGTLLLGVVRDEEDFFLPWQIVGVAQPDKLSADLATRCASEFNVPVRVDIRSESVQEKVVLVVTVPEAPSGDKPLYIKSRGLPRGAYRRIGSTDQECTEEDLLALFQGRQVESFDATLMPDAELQDIEPDAVADYRQSLASGNPSAEALRLADEDLLHAIGALRRDTSLPGHPLRPTVAGVVLFSVNRSRCAACCLPCASSTSACRARNGWATRNAGSTRSISATPCCAPSAVRWPRCWTICPRAFTCPEGALERRDIPLLPVNVVREAIVNAVMHRSYRVHGAVQLIRYSNRLEVRNPGYSLKPVEHLGEPGSQVRNTRIANVLYDTRLAETKGTGVGAMRRLMEAAGLESPLFASNRGSDQFVATYYFQHFLNEEAIAWLSRFKDLKLSGEEAKALVAVREQGAIDNAMYRELNRVDPLSSSQTLRRLRDAGLLEQKGRGSATYYVPTAYLLELPETPLAPKPEPLSPKLDALSPKPPALSTKPDVPFDPADLPAALRAQVQALGRRSPPGAVEDALVALCRWQPQGADALAARLGRRRDTVSEYIARLVSNGRLQPTRPEHPRHPQQAYRAGDAQAAKGEGCEFT